MDESEKYDVFVVNYNVNISSNGKPDVVKEVALIASDNINKVMNFMRRSIDDKLYRCHIAKTKEKSNFQGLISDSGNKLLKVTEGGFEFCAR